AQKDLLAAEKERDQAEVGLRAAREKLGALKVNGADLTVTSPRAGIVVERAVSVGQSVSPDAPDALAVVADLSTVWVVAELCEAEAVDIKEGTQATVSSPSLLGAPVAGTVGMVSAVVDPIKHTIPIRVKLANPGTVLRPNLFAQVRFLTPPPPGLVEVQASAILTDGTQTYVYVEEPAGKFVKRTIVAGAVREGRVPVHEGLRAGENVVEEGGVLLDNQVALVE